MINWNPFTGFRTLWKSLENVVVFHFFWESLEKSEKLWILLFLKIIVWKSLSMIICNNAEHNIYVWIPVCLPVGSVGAIFVYIFAAELADLLISFAWFSLHWWLFLLMRFYWMFLIGSFSLCEVWKTVMGTNIRTLWTFFAW